MRELKLLDLFSGIGGFTLAAERADIKTVAFCEIDKFPQSVLKYRFPEIPIIEDVRNLNKETFKDATGLDYTDIICGGSPCQSMSVAGNREGFRGVSGIFYEYARIVRELMPKYVVWENVPGALSSSGGRDFEAVLCSFTGWDGIEFDRWGTCGFFRGRSGFYNVAYRIFDSRHFGVPQRRKRIFLVGSLGDESCAEILFEPQSLRGNPASGEKSRKGSAAFAQGGFGGYYETPVGGTLTKSSGSCSGGSETLIVSENSVNPKKDAPTITSRAGTGGNNLPLIVKQHNHGEVSAEDIAPTLSSQSGAGRIPMAVSVRENIINRQDHNGGNGAGALEENSYTLNATGVHAVAAHGQIRRLTPLECERLQGFPDNWTLTPTARDTNRYKACGNAITVNVAEWIFKRLVDIERKKNP